MTPQERDVIAGIFDRLKQAANQPRDPEAERFIADKLREQPYAPYAMAQAVYVQEQALLNLQAQVEELQAQAREAEQRQSEQQGGGFLSGIFGGAQPAQRPRAMPPVGAQRGAGSSGLWSNQSAGGPGGRPAPDTPMQPDQGQPGQSQPGPWGRQAAAGQQPGGGSGFLGGALTTAAGVAGGMMLGNVLMNAFKGEGSAQAATPAASNTAESGSTPDAQPAADNTPYDDGSSGQPAYQNASYDDAAYDDGSSFIDDGGDDWA